MLKTEEKENEKKKQQKKVMRKTLKILGKWQSIEAVEAQTPNKQVWGFGSCRSFIQIRLGGRTSHTIETLGEIITQGRERDKVLVPRGR